MLLHGKMRSRNQFWVTAHELVGQGAAPGPHGRAGAGPPRHLRDLAGHAAEARHGRTTRCIRHVVEPLPARLRVAEALADRPAALAAAHFPDTEEDAAGARQRLAFEELFLLQLAVAGRRRAQGGRRAAAALAAGRGAGRRLRGVAPVRADRRPAQAIDAIDADLAKPSADAAAADGGGRVSGKTVVALHAMLRAAENGRQAALMAPTETLAEQHLITLDRLLGGARAGGAAHGLHARRRAGATCSRGWPRASWRWWSGTHALIEEPVEFHDLAVCVVDEQHRFGVRQRAALDAKAPEGLAPHALHMTATPIPRTLALTAYGDLEATVLRELPAGRRPVETHVVDGARARARAYERIREEIAQGPPVLRGLPAGRGVRGAPGARGHRRGRAPAGDASSATSEWRSSTAR